MTDRSGIEGRSDLPAIEGDGFPSQSDVNKGRVRRLV